MRPARCYRGDSLDKPDTLAPYASGGSTMTQKPHSAPYFMKTWRL